jgi:hypothetical protein
MVAYVFQRLLDRGVPTSKDVSAVKDWFADNTVKTSQTRMLTGDTNRQSARPYPGRLCMFTYIAKGKETLKYYDRFPLVFPIDIKADGFMGLNLHYLPPPERAKLMDALWPYISDDKLPDSAVLEISYKILKGAARLKYYKPCIKHYLNTNVMSRFVQIDPSEWNMALFLPTERFVGRSKNIVFNESMKKVKV